MMDFIACAKGRRSIRVFTGAPVPHDTVARITDVCACAPSWKNTQTARYTLVESAGLKAALADSVGKSYMGNARIIESAPAVVVLSSVKDRSGYERDGSFSTKKGGAWEAFDAGIAAQTFCLAAYNEGLGTVIMGIFDEDAVGKLVGIPETERVSALIAVGYPAEAPVMPKRKTVEELLTFR